MACPDASAAIHECVLAIRARVPVEVLADTIHAFPSTSRILNGLFAEALARRSSSARTGRPTPVASARTTTSPSISTSAAGPSRARRPARPGRQGARPGARRDPRAGRGRAGRDRARAAVSAGRDAGRPERLLERERLVRPEGRRCRPASVPSTRVTAIDSPGHGSIGSTGASVPNATTAPRLDRAMRHRVAARLRPVAPERRAIARVGPDVDRLDRGRDPGRGEPGAIVRMEQLDVLEARHQRRPAGRRLEHVERGPDAPVADRVDLRRDPGVGRAPRDAASRSGGGQPDPALRAGRQRPARLGLDRLEEGGGPRRQRPVGEQLQPAEPGPAAGRSRADRRSAARARPRSPSCSERIEAWTRIGRSPRSSSTPVGRDRPPEALLERRARPGSWTATTPERIRSRGEPLDRGSRRRPASPAGHDRSTMPRRGLVEDAGRARRRRRGG